MKKGRLIAFEGVDGAGKSTALKLVAERLREGGHSVFLPRMGKEHASRPTRHIRRLTRDPRNLDLTPRAELLLYCAREAQVLKELVRPALDRGETVLIDRSLLTPVVLGCGRGLARDECEAAARLASDGLEPDLTLVFDVHPRTSRIRKRIEKIRTRPGTGSGRKGLAGTGLKERVRDQYNTIAAERGYPLFHVERATPAQLAQRVVRVVEEGAEAGVGETEQDRHPVWLGPDNWTLEQALESMPMEVALFLSNGLISARKLRAHAISFEPALAVWAMDPSDPLREQAAVVDPDHALRGWSRRPLDGDDDLRLRLLDKAPEAAIGALKHLDDGRSDEIREQYAERFPGAVLTSLTGREDPRAVALRRRCWKLADVQKRATSLGFCTSDEAWKLREAILEKEPVIGIGTLRGLRDPRAQAYLERYADQAPKAVLSALTGRDDEAAYALRDALWDTGREVVDSVRGLADDRAYDLRERALEIWPSTVAHSLWGLQDYARTAGIRQRCEQIGAGDAHVLRRIRGLDERDLLPDWATTRTSLKMGDFAA